MTPLAKRLPRELRRNIGKYLGIFLLMCGSIALTSGFLLAAHSIGCLIDDMRDAYTIEDGRVTTSFEATKDQLKAAEDAAEDVGGVTFYKNFSIDAIIKKAAGDDGTKRTLRTYAHRTKVDIASYCEGRQPKTDDEVAIDRVFAPTTTSPWAIRSSLRAAPTPSAASWPSPIARRCSSTIRTLR